MPSRFLDPKYALIRGKVPSRVVNSSAPVVPAAPVVPTGDLLGLNKSNNNSNNNSNSKEFEYAVIYDTNLDVFVKEVENRIEEGWKLHGGFAVDNGKFYQAIIIQNGPSISKELSTISMGGRRSATRKNRCHAN
jgi:hypothetical protein